MTPQNFTLEPNLRALFKDLGIAAGDVCRRAGLPDDVMTRLPVPVPPAQYFALWEALEAEVQDPTFPIRLTEAIAAESLSPAVFGALCSPNLRVAAARLRDYKRLIAPVVLEVSSGPGGLEITFTWPLTSPLPPRSMTAFELVLFTRLARIATRERIVPLRVTSPNPPEPAVAYTDFLGIAIEPVRHGILFSSEDAERPFLTANHAMWSTFEPELRRRLSTLEQDATTTDRVKAVLLESLPSGQTSMAATCKRLGVSNRTLQRRLHAEGTMFADLLSATRDRLARHYLGRTSYTAAEIALLLGFEQPSSFYRAFQEWTGTTPEAFRAALVADASRASMGAHAARDGYGAGSAGRAQGADARHRSR